MEKKGLGKGLNTFFLDTGIDEGVKEIEISKIFPDPDQHRKTFSQETIRELSDSIKVHGVIQPLIVRKDGENYKIVAGERRYRASILAGLEKLPVIVRDDISDRDAAEIALIENLQREDLNPVDEAKGYEKLISDFNITQDEAAQRVGKSRVAVTNALRLLKLPDEVLEHLRNATISAGHARALLPLKNKEDILEMLSRIINEGLSVRDTENEVRWTINTFIDTPVVEEKPLIKKGFSISDEYLLSVQKLMAERLSRRVKIKQKPGKTSGKITLDYHSSDDLETILSALCGEDFLDLLDK
ncbi:MAG: ParB/RepB/Spo0J family partition protein [Ruminococcaceae bacterium]|nr:ParB/RepB/Spo0J family partition protein [Oscillospiraceae bacterium]